MMMVTKWQPRYSTMKAWDPFAELAGFRRFFDQPLTEGSTQPFSLVGTDGVIRFQYSLSGDNLTLTTTSGQSLTFTRVGGAGQY